MRSTFVVLVLTIFIFQHANAQVDDIKRASRKASADSGSGGSSGSSESSFIAELLVDILFSGVVQEQEHRLEQKERVPGTLSLDIIFQSAFQPSGYYIVHPRIRGNWGLISTDYRVNYIIEEDFDGMKHIRTNEWQLIQLNIVSTKDVKFRIGGGFLQEAFEKEQYYGEWAAALQVHPSKSKWGGVVEYRDGEARREISGYARYHWFDRGIFHGYLTAGAVHQKYYDTVSVWGLQGGCIISLY